MAYDLDPAIKEVVRVRDAAGGAPFADQVTRLPGGPVTSLSFGNGFSLAQGFDLRYQPVSVASGPLQLGYTMSPAGDVAGIQEGETPRTFQYDFLDRLVSSPEWLRYAYDGTGNRTSETVEGARASYAFYNGAYSDRMTTRLVPGASGNVKTHAFGHDYLTNVTAIGLYNAAGTSVAKAVCLRRDPPPGFGAGVGGAGGAGGLGGAAAVGGAVLGGLAISGGTVALICAATDNYYDFCKFWFPKPKPGPKPPTCDAPGPREDEPKKKGYQCTAKCQTSGGPDGAAYVQGTSNKDCRSAVRAAKAKTPLGQYPRHCSCKDTEGFRGVGHQCEAHRR